MDSDGINSGIIASISAMDDDSALDYVLTLRPDKASKLPTVKASINKMDNCLTCKDKSKRQCFKCMDEFYSRMHDVDGKVMKVEVDQVRLVRHPITGKRFDPKHTKAVSQ